MEAIMTERVGDIAYRVDAAESLWELAERVPEEKVKGYIREAARSLAAGAYKGAIVALWNGVNRIMRLAIEKRGDVGWEVFMHFYRDDEGRVPSQPVYEAEGALLINTCHKLHLFPNRLWNRDRLHDLRKIRNDCAHAKDTVISAQDAREFIEDVRGLLEQRTDLMLLQELTVVMECLEDPDFCKRRTDDWMNVLVEWTVGSQRETLAGKLLDKLFDEERDIALGRILDMWKALAPKLDEPSRLRLMERLSVHLHKMVSEVAQRLRAEDVARVIFWPEARNYPPIWDYFVSQPLEQWEDLPTSVVKKIRNFVPESYREQVDQIIKNMEVEL